MAAVQPVPGALAGTTGAGGAESVVTTRSPGWYAGPTSRRALVALTSGVFALLLGVAALRSAFGDESDRFEPGYVVALCGYAALLALAAYALGLPDARRSVAAALGAAVAAGAFTVGIVLLLRVATGSLMVPVPIVLGAAGPVTLWLVACTVAQTRASANGHDRVVLVGDAEQAERLRAELRFAPERPADVVGVLPPDVAGDTVARLVEASHATVLVLASPTGSAPDLATAGSESVGPRVCTLPQFYEVWLGKVAVNCQSELPRLDVGGHRGYAPMKRILDVVLAAMGLVVLAAVLPLVIIGNLVSSRGPLLYRQLRTGRHGTQFRILKLRTMRPTPGGPLVDEWTTEDDPRITSFGRVLRAIHLDELPQVINVLRGELSVVGARPEQPRYVASLVRKLPMYDVRHGVLPGITGWAQVKYGYAGDETGALQKLEYDLHYVRNRSLAFDLRILARTTRGILGRGGR